jgi:hypothetical protein
VNLALHNRQSHHFKPIIKPETSFAAHELATVRAHASTLAVFTLFVHTPRFCSLRQRTTAFDRRPRPVTASLFLKDPGKVKTQGNSLRYPPLPLVLLHLLFNLETEPNKLLARLQSWLLFAQSTLRRTTNNTPVCFSNRLSRLSNHCRQSRVPNGSE